MPSTTAASGARMPERRETAVAHRNLRRRRVLKACCGLALCAPARGARRRDRRRERAAAGRRCGRVRVRRPRRPAHRPADVASARSSSSRTRCTRDAARPRRHASESAHRRAAAARRSSAAETRARAADGIVAYSGVCTHTGCDVTDWYGDVLRFKCPCHESEFDPSDGARVVGGPAPWQLAALPLKARRRRARRRGARSKGASAFSRRARSVQPDA